MIKKQAYFKSDNTFSNIRTLIWEEEESAPVGVVQIVPSFGDHMERYDAFARFLAHKGFVVCGADHVGHGGSVSSAAELGAVNDNAHLTVIRDMHTLWRIMSKKNTGLPYSMVGIGVGSFAARIFAGAFPELLSSLILVGTSQAPDALWALSDPVKTLLARLPRGLSSAAAPNVLFGKLTKRLYKDKSELSWLCENEETLAAYIADPYTGFPMTRQLTEAMLQLFLKGSEPATAEALPPTCNVMFLSGAKDSFGIFGRGVMSASDAYASAGLAPEVILYPVMRHDILHERDCERVFGDIAEFLM